MKIADPEGKSPEAQVASSIQDKLQAQSMHPFVKGMANAGAILGRDIGVLALKAIHEAANQACPVLYWTADFIPLHIKTQVPAEMEGKVHGAMIVPHGAVIPTFNFTDAKVRTASRIMMDGSQLIVFEKADVQDNDAAVA